MVLGVGGSVTNRVEAEVRSFTADVVPSRAALEACSDFAAASIKARRLFFLGLEVVGGSDAEEARGMAVEEDRLADFICSDSFCFVFLVDGFRDAGFADDDVCALCRGVAGGDDVGVKGKTTDTFSLFFACALVVTDDEAAVSSECVVVGVAVTSYLVGGVFELAAALQ